MIHRFQPRFALAVFLVGLTVAGPSFAADAPKKFALLVGCTKYINIMDHDLEGPINDVRVWNRLLTDPKRFAFPQVNVTRLAGWPDDPKERPTCANIVREFEKLVDRSGPNVQIFILLSGHGTQIPIPKSQANPLDPKNPEPDGMDEVFLPADVGNWGADEQLSNAILDDQICIWLDKMRDKGASVWIVIDCCCSGMMAHGTQSRERPRALDAIKDLGVPRKAIEDAARRAREAVAKANGSAEAADPSPLDIKPDPKACGKLVAFYASQAFEEAPELTRPAGAAHVPENYFSLLSYTLVKALEQQKSSFTYRELSQLIAARYKAERGNRPPTPFAEGDLDLKVLGLTVWPDLSDISLMKQGQKLTVNAGELRGLTPGSILMVHPPVGEKRVLGYVLVEKAMPMEATVVPCDGDGKLGGDADKLLDRARCAIFSRDLGYTRVKIALEPKLLPTFAKFEPKVRAMVQPDVPEPEADWVLRQVTQQEAKEIYGLDDVKGDCLLLLRSEGRVVADAEKKQTRERLKIFGKRDLRKVFGSYAVADTKSLIETLQRDLQKVFKVQNLWRVSGGLDGHATLSPDYGLKLEVMQYKDKIDPKGEALRTPSVTPGQLLGFHVENTGSEALWVTALYCDANFKVEVYYRGKVLSGQRQRFRSVPVSADSIGIGGMIVFALPVKVSKEQPNYDFLEQEPLGKSEDKAKKREPDDVRKAPFRELLGATAFNTGKRRIATSESSLPAIRSATWVTLPPTKPSAR